MQQLEKSKPKIPLSLFKAHLKVQAIRDELLDLDKEREKAHTRLLEAKKYLENVCTHPLQEIKDDYIAGGYYDRDQYRSWKVCKVCEAILTDISIRYGSYG